ncbi:MAG: transcription termination/antitermination protein NusA [Treponema sp.]|nr:transcription termination/antitermination protein NusA [Treponema sp.]MCI6890769.1 transcription termination factor NusA [Treponema sp.]
MSEMAEAIRQLIQEKGYSEDSVRQTIEKALKAAYKRTYGTDENAIVKFNEDMSDVAIYSRKVVLDGVWDPVKEIELEDAKKLAGDDVEEGDEIDILEDPKSFNRSAVSTGKQTAHQGLNETYKNSLMNEYKDKVGEIIIGYHQRERNGNIYLDLGNAGRLEGVLPVKYQSKLEVYEKGDRIKALIVEVKPTNSGVQLVLSRSDPKLVSSILEKEVPEIADGTVEIEKIVRDAGYRTKIAVSSKREEVDPVGACVGLKGVRIQNVIRELLNEKIDVLKYDPDPVVFIKNALSPAQVERVIIMDNDKRQALAIVEDSQFSLAIGRQGQNVRLANRLCDWNIDVKTIEQAEEMDLSAVSTVQNARNLFSDNEESYDEITTVAELPGVDAEVAKLLKDNGIEEIQDFVEAYDNKSINIEGVSQEALDKVNALITENVEFVEEDEEEKAEETSETPATDAQPAKEENDEAGNEEEYFCPECGAKITLDMTHCPNCGVEFEFTDGEE